MEPSYACQNITRRQELITAAGKMIQDDGCEWMDGALQKIINELDSATVENMLLDEWLSSYAHLSSSFSNQLPNREASQEVPQLTDTQLVDMPVTKLNKFVVGLPKQKVSEIRHRRRCLKNREYAQNSRRKRDQQKESLETSVARLQRELSRMRMELEKAKKERDLYKSQINHFCGHKITFNTY